MIETGYKPEFGLGAMYQGFNAANADQSAELELVKQFLANQREQQMQPLDVDVRRYDSNLANAKSNSPDYIPWAIKGQIGQMMSQDAAGRGKQATYEGDVKLAQSENKNKQFTADLMSRLNQLKQNSLSNPESGQIGFPMQESQTPTRSVSGFFTGSPEHLAKSKALINNIPNNQNKHNTLQTFTTSTSQNINTNNSQLVQQPPRRNGGISPGGAEYEQTMQALLDQPELRSKLLQGDQKFDSAEYGMWLRHLDAQNAASKRSTGPAGKDPFMEWNKLSPAKRVGILEWSKQLGINPITRQPITSPQEQQALDLMYEQDIAVVQQGGAESKTAGKIDIPAVTQGEIPTTPVPPTRTRGGVNKPSLPAGWTLK